ncbi:hypothetical protein GLOTRDRAFT_111209 [Gloeophyllum trabeum ATCC 11539]|uniref:Uncharacterized protein n=1 Tax=Gloeophyllum trabeum (strain ATCC 11539 / FP-39264 / Madison 617) TaxID=670483 RepID=S7Q742_GLOTA|nr:uncharacterized protein GLOTRDRAFT_111209 [Gloeophyllum trabeum ATCC 11539]EPQ55337.1 hypothetical protein GLOTRDRAFT_111209 [Gloeophyllum trabeum ATCC 11539]
MSSSSTSAPTQTSFISPNDVADKRVVALGISLGVVGFLVIVGIVFYVLRLRKRTAAVPDATTLTDRNHQKYLRHTDVDARDPAHRVVPFGSPGGETPRFVHTPGANMRVAQRGPDGAWEFFDPARPLTPSGFRDPDSMPPSPSSTVFTPRVKDNGMKPWQFTNRDFEDWGSVGVPPPAYGMEEGYISKAV